MINKLKSLAKKSSQVISKKTKHRRAETKVFIPRSISHINELRTSDYRVFFAAPYFSLDLVYEISWQKRHIRQLQKHLKKPHTYHGKFTEADHGEHRRRHFQEHVVDSIPFHKKILEDHEKRLKTIESIVPPRTYRKLVDISKKHRGTPEFFVYDKKNKDFFFIAEHVDALKRKWIELVRDKHKICNVYEINQKI